MANVCLMIAFEDNNSMSDEKCVKLIFFVLSLVTYKYEKTIVLVYLTIADSGVTLFVHSLAWPLQLAAPGTVPPTERISPLHTKSGVCVRVCVLCVCVCVVA